MFIRSRSRSRTRTGASGGIPPPPTDTLLTEAGDNIVQENGSQIILDG